MRRRILAWCFKINSVLINASIAVMPVVERIAAATGATMAAINADKDEYLIVAAATSQAAQKTIPAGQNRAAATPMYVATPFPQ